MMLSGFHDAVCLSGLAQRKNRMSNAAQRAPGKDRPYLFAKIPGHLGLEGVRAGPQGRAGVTDPFEHHWHQVNFNLRAEVECQLDDARVVARGLYIAGDIIATDDIEDNVGAACLATDRNEILFVEIDGTCRPK